MTLKDVRTNYTFDQGYTRTGFYKKAMGELGVPGQVLTHRDPGAQTEVSSGTGEHAGHLIAIKFGPPGGLENLGLQNPNMNTYSPKPLQEAFQGSGGSYYRLECRWTELLHKNYKIHVTVTDRYRPGENRPYTRSVEWTETPPGGGLPESKALEFVNFTSPQSRAKSKP